MQLRYCFSRVDPPTSAVLWYFRRMPPPTGFTMVATRDRRVLISHHGRLVVTLAGPEAERLLSRAESANEEALQMLLAKATGNFARHNKPGGKG